MIACTLCLFPTLYYLCIMEKNQLYRTYSDFLSHHFPFKVQKLPIDAGFTCPNRDGTKGRGGCTYCVNRSFHPNAMGRGMSIREQLEVGKQFFAGKYPEMKYLAYFQSYTNTYAPISELRQKYEEALEVDDIVGVVISTRPDCLPPEVMDYLSELRNRIFVMLEIGVESTDEQVLQAVNRCHTFADSEDAIRRAAARNIPVCAHLILGLSHFGTTTVREEALHLSETPISSVKIHQLQILRGTSLSHIYEENCLIQHGESNSCQQMFPCLQMTKYIEELGAFVSHLRPDIAIERFVSQSPSDLLIAPHWGIKPDAFQELFEKYLIENNLFQGKFIKKSLSSHPI